jgi:hypothetical protein
MGVEEAVKVSMKVPKVPTTHGMSIFIYIAIYDEHLP